VAAIKYAIFPHGNEYKGGHSSYAGIREGNVRGFVKWKDSIFYCWNKCKGIQPNVTPGWQNYWIHSPTQIFDSTRYGYWNVDSTYWDALPIHAMGAVAKNNFWGFYVEGGQGKVAIGQESVWWNPSAGVEMVAPYMNKFGASQGRMESESGRGFYKNDKDSVHNYVAMTDNEGLMIGSERAGMGRIAMKYKDAQKALWYYANGFQVPTQWINGINQTGLTNYGRDTVFQGSRVVGMEGEFYSDISDGSAGNQIGSRKRMFAAGTKPPTHGRNYGVGDFILNISADTTIIGWKCTQTKPTKWTAIKSAN